MGQASSVPVVVAPADPKATPQPKPKKELKIPSAWKGDSNPNHNEFVMISPQSDISNPSHFRGKKHAHPVNLADTSATMQRRAHRTSKVCSKVPAPHLSAGVPIPSRFYFQGEDEEDDVNDENENQKPAKKPNNENPKPQMKAIHPSNQHNPPPPAKMSKFTAKCIKAKQHLSECWKEREEVAPPEERVIRHYSQREHAAKSSTAIPTSNFQPVWKEAESHPPVLVEKANVSAEPVQLAPVEEKKKPEKPEVISPNATQEKPPIVTSIRVSDIVRTFSQETAGGTSTVLQQKSTASGSTHRSSVASTVLQHQHPATANASIFRPLLSEPAASQQLPVQPNLSNSTTETSASQQVQSKKRASIEKQSRRSSEPVVKNRRSSEISMHMQRQIDEQVMVVPSNNPVATTATTNNASRVQRLRHQYQQEVEKKFLIVQEETRKQNDIISTNKTSDRFSMPRETKDVDDVSRLTVAEKRQVFESKPRYASVPKQRVSVQPTLHTKASTAANTRSVSAPRASQLPDGTALLALSGSWEVPQKTTAQTTTQLPVLLQMAGWKPAPTEPSRRASHPRLSQTNSKAKPRLSQSSHPNSNKSSSHRVSQDKENNPTDHHQYPSNVVVAKPQIKDIKVRHSMQAHTMEKNQQQETSQKVDTTKQIRKAASFDTAVLSKRPATSPKGRSIAFMLQQAYFGHDDDDDTDDCVVAKPTIKVGKSVGSGGGYLKHLLSPRANKKQLVEASPAFSVDSVPSTTNDSVPVVSDQAIWNADFLFHRDGFPIMDASLEAEAGHRRSQSSHHSTSGFTLSTMDSRNRVVTSSIPAALVPPPSSALHKEEDEVSVPRRVRFSEETFQSSSSAEAAIPKLETKLSDLTDNHSTKEEERESVAMSIPRIDSIPEEEDDEEGEHIGENGSPSSDNAKPPVMRWSYRTSTSTTSSTTVDSRGVTPLLGNKTSSKIAATTATTNSPYLRFKQAKDKFASFGGKGVSPAKAAKPKPTKRISPTKTIRQNLVTSRIAAMEGRRFQRCSGDSMETTRSPFPAAKPPAAAKHSKSPLLQRVQRRFHSATPPMIVPQNSHDEEEEEKVSSSPMLINGQVILSPDPFLNNNHIPHEDAASVISNDDSEEDVFGALLHPTTIDDDDDSELVPETSDDDDAFDRLLNYTESYEEPYADHSAASTVLQPSRFANMQQKTTTVIRHQPSSDTTSIASLASSSGDTATIPHWLLHQGGRNVPSRSSVASSSENSSVVSAVGRMKGVATSEKPLPFREVAPVQPMRLQRHRYSEDPSVVEPPRTWRAMAVAAQDRALSDRSNFQ